MQTIRSMNRAKPAAGFILLLLLCNLHLLQGSPPSALLYRQEMVAAGEWWRIFTHLLVHVSWYHLILDGAAVALLWSELKFDSLAEKFIAAALCAAGSLLWATWFSPHIAEVGFCGLSGMAHGLIFLLGLWWIWRSSVQQHGSGGLNTIQLGLGSLLVLFSGGKSIIEVASGSVLFTGFHLGDLGVPIVHAHLGGVVGGLLAFLLIIGRYYLVPGKSERRQGEKAGSPALCYKHAQR